VSTPDAAVRVEPVAIRIHPFGVLEFGLWDRWGPGVDGLRLSSDGNTVGVDGTKNGDLVEGVR